MKSGIALEVYNCYMSRNKNHKSRRGLKFVLVLLVLLSLGVGAWYLVDWLQPQVPITSYKFQTPKDESAVIAAVGDIACLPGKPVTPTECQHEAVYGLVELHKPDEILLLGDIQYDDGELFDFQNSFDKSWGNSKDKMRPVPGNHEYEIAGASGYYDYFGERAGEKDKGYYSFDVGKWHAVALNSVCDEAGGCGPGSPQYEWLKKDLAENPEPCTLAFWHHPVYTSGQKALIPGELDHAKPFWELLTQAKTDVILNGHDHLYERFGGQNVDGVESLTGPLQFTVGTGGKSLYKQTSIAANSKAVIDDSFGILLLELKAEEYVWQFIDTANLVRDQGSAKCVN